jgi:hypothetical protein
MKKRIIALVVGTVLLLCSSLPAQAPDTLWTRTFGGDSGDIASSIHQTLDGGYIMVGGTNSFGNGKRDVYLVKMDMNGDFLWSNTFGGLASDWGSDVQQTSDGGYIITGGTSSFGAGLNDVYLIRTDSLGDSMWTKTHGGNGFDFARSVDATLDGGYVIAGATTSFGAGWYDFYLVKTDSLGNLEWEKAYGGPDEDISWSVQQTSDNGYIMGGYTDHASGNSSAYLVKTDSFGDTIWTKKYGGPNGDQGYASSITNDNGFIIVGETSSFGPPGQNVYIVKCNEYGDTVWTRAYGGEEWDFGFSVQETSDNGFVVAGETVSYGSGNGDFYVLKVDEGDTLWTKTYGGNQWEYALSIQNASDGGYIIAGYTESYGQGNGDAYIVKTEPDPTNINEKHDRIPASTMPKFAVSPNPFTTVIKLEIRSASRTHESTLHIYDAAGRVIKSVTLATSTYQLGTDLVPGIYFLKLNGTPVGKVVKVR